MTLLLPAADRVVREAVDAVLEGRSRPGVGSDVSFATRSSRYRVIHGVLREASDASLVGARFVGWLFDAGREPLVSERWDTDARAVLIDESKGQIVVTSLTRVHVANALSTVPGEDERASGHDLRADGFPARAGTLHGIPVVDPEPEQAHAQLAPELPTPGPAAGAPPAPDVPTAATPSPPQASSPVPKRTIPPAPPIPGRQATPIPMGRHATPLMPMRPMSPAHAGTRTAPMQAVPRPAPPPPPASVPAATPAAAAPAAAGPTPASPPRIGSTHLGLAPATRFPPGPQEPIVLTEPLMTPEGPVDLSSLEEVSAQLAITGEVSAAIGPVITGVPAAPAEAASAAPAPSASPGWAKESQPLPQFDLDDADLDLPTRADPMPPAPPSEEDAVIPLIPRS